MPKKRLYWDTSCFISFLSSTHSDEALRASICEDILNHAKNDEVEIWTSVWTIVETIRPKAIYKPKELPIWSELLRSKEDKGNVIHPKAIDELERIWTYYNRNTLPARHLSEVEVQKIKGMFDWTWIKKIQIVPAIAHRAAEIARSYNMKPGDALHVASALNRTCDVIQRWDKDYSRTDSIIPSEEPSRLTSQTLLGLPLV